MTVLPGDVMRVGKVVNKFVVRHIARNSTRLAKGGWTWFVCVCVCVCGGVYERVCVRVCVYEGAGEGLGVELLAAMDLVSSPFRGCNECVYQCMQG